MPGRFIRARLGRRSLPLWALMLFLLGGMVAYVAGVAMYLAMQVAPAAEELRRRSEPLRQLFAAVAERDRELDAAYRAGHQLVLSGAAKDTQAVRLLHDLRWEGTLRTDLAPFVDIPSAMQTSLALSDDQASMLAGRLTEVSALMELGRTSEAMARLKVVDSLQQQLVATIGAAQRVGVDHLLEHERDLVAEVTRAETWLLGWALLGAVSLPVAVALLRRRLVQPLARLERGLSLVASGDLGVQLPVRRDDELGQLTAHFNEMTRVLRARAEEQGRFAAAGELLAGVAHEVNNPLMAISGLAETRRTDPALAHEVRADFEQIGRQSRRAGKLLSGLLRFVRAGDRELIRVDLNAVLRDATDLVSFQLPVNEIALELRLDPALPAVIGDPARYEQVFVNLLANAVDALCSVPTPRRIVVSSEQRDGQVRVTIRDNGPGISPEIAGRLFLPFVSSKGAHGTGLGLYISRQLLRQSGGELSVESAERGACFAVRLPAAPALPFDPAPIASAEVEPAPPSADGTLRGCTVLVLDDESAVRRPIVRYLERLGARVLEADDGIAGLGMVTAERVDAVLADLRMPRMDGVAFYQRLVVDHPAVAERLVFLSGDLTQLEREGELPVPAARVLVKPVDLQVIRSTILAVMAESRPPA